MASSNHAPGTEFLECPVCGSDIYDNREKIESGEWNARSPHFACKEKTSCGWASWPEKDKKGGRGATRATKAHPPARTVSGPLTGGYSWADQTALGQACLDRAYKQMKSVMGAKGLEPRAVVAWAATGMIGAKQDHLMPPESLDDMPKTLKDFSKTADDLPFDDDPGMEE